MQIDRRKLHRLGTELAWLLCAAGVLAIFFAAFDHDGLRHVPRAYREAVARATADAAVQDALGAPVEVAWWREFDVDLRPGPRRMRMTVHLAGSRGTGVLRIEAHRQGGRWRFDRLAVEPEDGVAAISLL